MNVSPDGKTVQFTSEPKTLFEAERSGAKPNTVRILDVYEADQIRHEPPTKIIIQNQQDVFLRTLTGIHFDYGVFGKVIAIFSWANERHHHTVSHEEPDPYAHTMSLDDTEQVRDDTEEIRPHAHTMPAHEDPPVDLPTAPILLPKRLILDLMGLRGNRTLPEFLSKLLESEKQERDGFVSVTITEPTLHKLQSIAHGRTTNMVIQELYQSYLDRRAEERGALHD